MNQRETLVEIKALIQSTQPVIAVETAEEERVRDLIYRASRELNINYFDWTITRGIRSEDVALIGETEDPFVCLQYIKDYEGEAVFFLRDLVQHLDKPLVIRQFREAAQRASRRGNSIVVVAPTIDLPREIRHKVHFLDWPLPTSEELKVLIETTLDDLQRGNKRFQVKLTPEEGTSLLHALSGLTWKQAKETLTYAVVGDGTLNSLDIQQILDRKAKSLRDGAILDYYPAHKLASDIGGFENLKIFCANAKNSFSSEARKMNLPPAKGILLVGVPGCGKSLAAKTIAATWNYPLLKLDAGRLFDKFIGESEKNFRKAIQAAEAIAPCIFWIDEIEKAMSVSQGSDSDGGLSRRLFGAFLTWLQEKQSNVFVIATANDISMLPPELLRKGRFDEVFFVDLPTEKERVDIIKVHLEKRQQQLSNGDISVLAGQTKDFSGAEIEHVIVTALLESVGQGGVLKNETILKHIRLTIPLAQSRSEDISQLREMARKNFRPVG